MAFALYVSSGSSTHAINFGVEVWVLHIRDRITLSAHIEGMAVFDEVIRVASFFCAMLPGGSDAGYFDGRHMVSIATFDQSSTK